MQVSSSMEDQDGEMVVKRLSVPVGLEELMTGLTREVLKKKPKDIYTFASEHFAQLLALRDNGNYRTPPSRTFTLYDQDDMENHTPNGNLRKSRSGGGPGRQLSRQVSIRAESPARKSRIRRSGTPKHDDNNNEGNTKTKQDKSKAVRRQTPGSKSKFDNLEPVKEDSLKAMAKKENKSRRSTDKKGKDSSGSKDTKRSSSEERENLKKKGENFSETKGKAKTKRKEASQDSTKFVPKSSSVEEATTGIKDGRLTVTPPKVIKEAQSPTDQMDLPTTLVVPVLAAASSSGKKESEQDEDIRKALKNDSETGEILSLTKEDSQDCSSKNYDSSALKEELKKVEEEAKLNNFTTSYNPYKLRQEIKNVSNEVDTHENVDALETEAPAGDTKSTHVNLESSLQHSGELHDTIIQQEEGAKDSTDDMKVLEDKEELNSKGLKKVADIGLQHSGELHDSLIPKEKATVMEDELPEATKTPVQLQHSSELHDTVLSKEIENTNGESGEKAKTPLPLQSSGELHDTLIPKDKEMHNIQIAKSPTSSPEKEISAAESTFASAAAAATKIQSLWRGFRVRKVRQAKVDELVDQHNVPESEISGNRRNLGDDVIMQAATKIQAGVRGYLTRKQQKNKISATKENVSTDEELHKALAQLDNVPIPNESPKLARHKRETEVEDISDDAVVKADDKEENSTGTEKVVKSKSVRELGSGKLNVPAFSKSFSVTDSAISKTLDEDEEKLRSLTEYSESLGEQTEDLGIESEMSSTQQLDQGKTSEGVVPDGLEIMEKKGIVEEPAAATNTVSSQLQDTVVQEEYKQINDSSVIPQGGESKQELPSEKLPSDIVKEETISKQLPESASTSNLQSSDKLHDLLVSSETDVTNQHNDDLSSTSLKHSSEIHDTVITKSDKEDRVVGDKKLADIESQVVEPPNDISTKNENKKTSDKEKNISTEKESLGDDNELTSPQVSAEQNTKLVVNTSETVKDDNVSPSNALHYSSELHDSIIPKESNESKDTQEDTGLGAASPHLTEESTDTIKIKKTETTVKDSSDLPSLKHSGELHDSILSKKSEENKDTKKDTGLVTVSPQLDGNSPDIAKLEETETTVKDSSELPSLKHSGELHDSIIPKESEENKDTQKDASLVITSQQLAEESPAITKTETNVEDSSELLSIEHSGEIHDSIIPKQSEENKDTKKNASLVTVSPQLGGNSSDASKVKETETNVENSAALSSLEHSGELHDSIIPKESEENNDTQKDASLVTESPQFAEELPDIAKIKETETTTEDSSVLPSLEHSGELHDSIIPKERGKDKDTTKDAGLVTSSPQLAEESPDIAKIKETETTVEDSSELPSLEHSGELHNSIISKESDENKHTKKDAGLTISNSQLAEESPDNSKIKETETTAKDSSELPSLEHSGELHDSIIPKESGKDKDTTKDAGLVTSSPQLAEESPDIAKIKETETTAKDSFELPSLEHSGELHDSIIPKESEEKKDTKKDAGLISASPQLHGNSPDTLKIKETETTAKYSSELLSLEHSGELHDSIISKESEENKDTQKDASLISPQFVEESLDISKIKEIETTVKDSSELPSLEHSGELHDSIISNEGEKNKDTKKDAGLVTASPQLDRNLPDTSKIKEIETTVKDSSEVTSREHSGELHDSIVSKESEENVDTKKDAGLVTASPKLDGNSPDIAKLEETETTVKDTSELLSLEHSGELHDSIVFKESEENVDTKKDAGLVTASPKLDGNSPDIAKLEETETTVKDSSELPSLKHSGELHDSSISKKSDEDKATQKNAGLVAASPQLAEESPDTSKIKEIETTVKDSSEVTSRDHSGELHDSIISKESEENVDTKKDAGLVTASPKLDGNSPDIAKLEETETTVKDTSELLSLKHSGELHDSIIPKESDEDKATQKNASLVTASPLLAEESPDISKIKETETTVKDSSALPSLEHSSGLHDFIVSKESEENEGTLKNAGLVTAHPHLAEELSDTSKIKETETNAENSSELLSLEHSGELHDFIIPREGDEDKDAQKNASVITVSPQLGKDLQDTSIIKDTETTAKDSSVLPSLEHSGDLHDSIILKKSEENNDTQENASLVTASGQLPDTSKLKQTGATLKDSSGLPLLKHIGELHDSITPKESEFKQEKNLSISSPLLTPENEFEKASGEDNSAPVLVKHTGELTKALVPSAVEEEEVIQESHTLSMQSPPQEKESQDTLDLRDTVSLNNIKDSNSSNDHHSTTPVPAQHEGEVVKTSALNTDDEEKTVKENENLIVPSPRLAEESHDTSSVNKVEDITKERSPTSITFQHSSELHDTAMPSRIKEKESLKMPRLEPTELKEIEKSGSDQYTSGDHLISDMVEKEHFMQEEKNLVAASPQLKNETENVNGNFESTTLQHSSELHDAIIPIETKKDPISDLQPATVEQPGEISEDDKKTNAAPSDSGKVRDNVIAKEAAVLTTAILPLGISKIGEIKQTDEEDKNTQPTNLQHSSKLQDPVIVNDTKDKAALEENEAVTIKSSQQGDEEFKITNPLVADVSEVNKTAEDDNHPVPTDLQHSNNLPDSIISNEIKKNECDNILDRSKSNNDSGEEKDTQSPVTTSNDDDKYVTSTIALSTEAINKFDEKDTDKTSTDDESLKATDNEKQDNEFPNSNKHQEETLHEDDNLASTSFHSADKDSVKESGKIDELDKSSLQHGNELHDTLLLTDSEKLALQDNTKTVTDDPKKPNDRLLENITDTSDEKAKSNQPLSSEKNNIAVNLEQPLESNKIVGTTLQSNNNLSQSLAVKESELSLSSLSHTGELQDTLPKQSEDLTAVESPGNVEETEKNNQKDEIRLLVASSNDDKVDEVLTAREDNQNEKLHLSKDVKTSKMSEQQNNALKEDANVPSSIDGSTLSDVAQQQQSDETLKEENLITKDVEDTNDMPETHQNLKSDNLMSKNKDKESDKTSKEAIEEKYEESHLSLVAADRHEDEHGDKQMVSNKKNPNVFATKKNYESKQTSGDADDLHKEILLKSASNGTTIKSEAFEPTLEQTDLEAKKEKEVDHKKKEDVQTVTPTQGDNGKDDGILSPKEAEFEKSDLANLTDKAITGAGSIEEKQEPTDSVATASDLNESTSLQHSGELHDLIFPSTEDDKLNTEKNRINDSTELQSEKDKEGHDSPEHYDKNGEAAPTTGLQHSGEFHDLLIPKDSESAISSVEEKIESKIGNGHLVNQASNVDAQIEENSTKLQDEDSAAVNSENGGSKTPAAQNQVQNVEVGKDDSNGNNIILNKQISSSVLDVPLEFKAPAPGTAAAFEALSDDVQRDNYHLHHKTEEEAKGQPAENLNPFSPVQDPHSSNADNRIYTPHNLDVDIQQPKQSTGELLHPHENIGTEGDRNGVDSEEKGVKEITKNTTNNASADAKKDDVNDVNDSLKNLNNENASKKLEVHDKPADHKPLNFDISALRAELASIENQTENKTSESSTDDTKEKFRKLEEPITSNTFDIAQLHSEIENNITKQTNEDQHELIESPIAKSNITLDNSPPPEKVDRQKIDLVAAVSNCDTSKTAKELDGKKDTLSEISQGKAQDNSEFPLNKDITTEDKSKESKADILSNEDTEADIDSKIGDTHEKNAVGRNLASASSEVNSKTVAEEAKLDNIENDKLSSESMKGNDDIRNRSKLLTNEDTETEELEEIKVEVKNALKDINDQHNILRMENDDTKVVDEFTKSKQSNKPAQDNQQFASNTEKIETDPKNPTKDTLANEISERKTNSNERNEKQDDNLTSTKEGTEENIEEKPARDDSSPGTFDISKLSAELENAGNVLQNETNVTKDSAVEELHNQQNRIQNEIEEKVKQSPIEDDKTESSNGVDGNATPLKTLIPNGTNLSTFDISTLRTELEKIEKQIETDENETNTAEQKSGEITSPKTFDISKLRSELEKVGTDENGDKVEIFNDANKTNKINENGLDDTEETANKLSQDKTKKSTSEAGGNLSSPPHAVESNSEKASANESLAMDYECAPTRPATSDITPSISLSENIQIPSDNVYKHAKATDLEPHNSTEIITSGSFKGEGNDEKSDPAKINKRDLDVHINNKPSEAGTPDSNKCASANLKNAMLEPLPVVGEFDNVIKDKIKLEEEIERPVSITSTTSTDSTGTVIFNAISSGEVDNDVGSNFEMSQDHASAKLKENKLNLEEKQPEGVNTENDQHNHYEVVSDSNQATKDLDADRTTEYNVISGVEKEDNSSDKLSTEPKEKSENSGDIFKESKIMQEENTNQDSQIQTNGDSTNPENIKQEINSIILGHNEQREDEEPKISKSKLFAVENPLSDFIKKNDENLDVPASIEPVRETEPKEIGKSKQDLNNLQGMDTNKSTEAKINEDNIITDTASQITKQDETVSKNKLKEGPEIASSKLPVVEISSADVKNKYDKDTSILHLGPAENITINENVDVKEIAAEAEGTDKESNRLQENAAEKSPEAKSSDSNQITENDSPITKKDEINSEILGKDESKEELNITSSKLAHVETSPIGYKTEDDEDTVIPHLDPAEKIAINGNVHVKEMAAKAEETLKEKKHLQEIVAEKSSATNANEGNKITESKSPIAKQDEVTSEILAKDELSEEPKLTLSKLAHVKTSPAGGKNGDDKDTVIPNLNVAQNLQTNEKIGVKGIALNSEQFHKEASDLQEVEAKKNLKIKPNENDLITESVSQIAKQDQTNSDVIGKNELKEHPSVTSFAELKNLDVAQTADSNEKVENKEIAPNPEESTSSLEIEKAKSSEINPNEDNVIIEAAPEITTQDETNSESVSKKKPIEGPEITSSNLTRVESFPADVINKNEKDIITPNLDIVKNSELNEKVEAKEIAPNSEETLTESNNLHGMEAEKNAEVKVNEDNVITEASPCIIKEDANLSKNQSTEKPKIASSALTHSETPLADLKNEDVEDTIISNLDVVKTTEPKEQVEVETISPNLQKHLNKSNSSEEIKQEKSFEVKQNDSTISETIPYVTIQNDMDSESVSTEKLAEEPEIMLSKLTLAKTFTADIKNKNDADIIIPNLDVTKNSKENEKIDVKKSASNSEETNNLQEIQADKSTEIKPNKNNIIIETPPLITTQNKVTPEVVNRTKLTEEPEIAAFVFGEKSPVDLKNQDYNEDIAKIPPNYENTVEENKHLQEIEANKSPEEKANVDNIITEAAPQITTQGEVNSEIASKNKPKEEPKTTLAHVETSPSDVNNKDAEDGITPNLDVAQTIDPNKQIEFKETEHILKQPNSHEEIEEEKIFEAKPNKDNSVPETESVRKNEHNEETEITSKLPHLETPPNNVKNKDEKNIAAPNLEVGKNIESEYLGSKEIAPIPGDILKETNTLQGTEAEKSPEKKANAQNIITEAVPQIITRDDINSETVSTNTPAEEPKITSSKLTNVETSPKDVESNFDIAQIIKTNEDVKFKEIAPNTEETIKESNSRAEAKEERNSEVRSSKDNIIIESAPHITTIQDEGNSKSVSKKNLTLAETSPTDFQNKDDKDTLASILDAANEKIDVKEIVPNLEGTPKETDNLQEIEADKNAKVKTNGNNIISKIASQITVQNEMNTKSSSKKKPTEEPDITSSKLKLVTSPADLKYKDDRDIDTPNLVAEKNETNEKVAVKETYQNHKETLKENNESPELKTNEANIISEIAPQITIQDEVNTESASKKKPTEEPEITSSKLKLVTTSPADLKNKDDRDINTPNLVAEKNETNEKIAVKETSENYEETLKETNASPEVKTNKANIISEIPPQITTQDEVNTESASKKKPTEKPEITSSKLKLVTSPADLKNKDDRDINTPNLVAEKNETNEKVAVKETFENYEETLNKTNATAEVKTNEANIISEIVPQITTQDEVNTESASKKKPTEEPEITSSKLKLVTTSPADLKNKDDRDINTPNLVAEKNETNEKIPVKETSENYEETLKETNASPEVKTNEANIISEIPPQITTQDEVNTESASKKKPTEKPEITSSKLKLVTSPADLKNKDDRDINTPNLVAEKNETNEKVAVKETFENYEETLNKTNATAEVKTNEANIISEIVPQITTQDEVNTESASKKKPTEEPEITSSKLKLVTTSPADLKNKDDRDINTPNLVAEQNETNEKVAVKEPSENYEKTLKETNASPEVKTNEANIISEIAPQVTTQDEVNTESASKKKPTEEPQITSSKLKLITTSPADLKNKDDRYIDTSNLVTERNETNEKADVKDISQNQEETPTETTESLKVKANADNVVTENNSPITKQGEMKSEVVDKIELKEEPKIILPKSEVVETSTIDVSNKYNDDMISPNFGVAQNIEPKKKSEVKKIAPNPEALETNELQEIDTKPEDTSSKLSPNETSPAGLKNNDNDMITPNSQFTKGNEFNSKIVSDNGHEEEPYTISAKLVPVDTSSDVKNKNDKYLITPNLDVVQKKDPHETTEMISNTEVKIKNVGNKEFEIDVEQKSDNNTITTDSSVAKNIELNEKSEIKENVQNPDESNNLQAKIKANGESITAEIVSHFTGKEDLKTAINGKIVQKENSETPSPHVALIETPSSNSRNIKDNIVNNVDIIKDVEPNEHQKIEEKTESIQEIPSETTTESADKGADIKTQETLLKITPEVEPSEEHKTIVEEVATKEIISKENTDKKDKMDKTANVIGISKEDTEVAKKVQDLPAELKELVQDKKLDQNRLDNSVTLLQEQGVHLDEHEAATKIQSGFRGYRVRRSLTMPLLETSSTNINNNSDELDEHIKNTLLQHIYGNGNGTIQEKKVPTKIELLNKDDDLHQKGIPAVAEFGNQKETRATPGDVKRQEGITATSPPTSLLSFEDENDSYDPFKHASAPPLSLLDHEEEFDLHNHNQIQETVQIATEAPKPNDHKEKEKTVIDTVLDVASVPTHLVTSKSILDNTLSPETEGIHASPNQKVKEEDIHVSSVQQPEGVSPRFHNTKDRPVTQALEIVLDQQLALTTPSAVKKEESIESEGPEYIYIPLKDPDDVSSPSKSSSEGLQHSGEHHDSVVVPLLTHAPSKEANLDAASVALPEEQKINKAQDVSSPSKRSSTGLQHSGEHHDSVVVPLLTHSPSKEANLNAALVVQPEEQNINKAQATSSDSVVEEEEEDSSKYDLVDSHKSPRTHTENESAVTKALGAVLDQQLAITTPKAKPKEKESSEEPKYIYIPLKDPNQASSLEGSDLSETKHEEQVGDKTVLIPAQHETKTEVTDVGKQESNSSLAKTNDLTPDTSTSEKIQPYTSSKIEVLPIPVQVSTAAQHFETMTTQKPKYDLDSVEKEDESHSSLTKSSDATPKKSSSEEAHPDTKSQTEVLSTPGYFEQAPEATALVLSSNLADAASSPVVITHQPSGIRSGSADTIPPGTPTLGLQVRFSPSPTQNTEAISASVSPIGGRKEGANSTQEDRSVQSESPPLVIQTTQISDVLPVAVQLNQPPAGAAVLTSPTRSDAGASVTAHAPSGGASAKDGAPGGGAHFQLSMETGNRAEAPTNGENMEELAATKIQASFRGYQVRKQLKCKNGGVESVRRSLRRKSSGKLRGSEKSSQKAPKGSSDLEEKSATKIQAGVRGFLVRRRQKKAKGNSSPDSS